ncbi:VOC family protein [Ignavibacterium sp.]|jgi:catechol 2,3-dioxygenase-like lactoylglutathione lyase family enzyme|uniref:VOC family protein n=1 Tax=Ignavibacterium sp. TaxID=2651167 RepID=UPI0025B897D8|nr:VOC family protein [Ignavibacterium sp.]
MSNKKILQGIDTVIIRVSDITVSKKWYGEKLGLIPIWDDQNMKLVVMDTDGPTSITLWQTNSEIINSKDTASYPIFRVIDADESRNELIKRGVNVTEIIEDNVVRYFQIFDPDGNVLEACQVHE